MVYFGRWTSTVLQTYSIIQGIIRITTKKESSSDSEGEASRSRVRPKREEESSKVSPS